MIQQFLQKKKKIQRLIKLSIKPYIKGWYPYQSCYEKRHFNVCGWVSFLARCFIRGNLTLFEILSKSFVLYTFISKKRHFLFCILFSSCFAILQLWVCFQYSIFLDCEQLENVCIQCSPSLVKNSDTCTKDAHE